jgi:hypothetical protein
LEKTLGQKPFGLSRSKAFPSPSKKGERFDKLTANGVFCRSPESESDATAA